MKSFTTTPGARHAGLVAGATTLVALVAAALLVVLTGTAAAAATLVPLGTASSFAVLAGSTVTNTGPSIISGDLGVSPGTAVTGFPPGTVIDGTIHAADPVAAQAQADLTNAYNNAAGQTPATVLANTDLGGQTLVGGIYKSASSLGLTGTVTLDGQNDPGSVFIFQAGSTLVTASNSTVRLINGASACNVFWQVGSSATLGTSTTFVGSILALTSITVQTTSTVAGRVLARNGQVSLDTNTITSPDCTTPPTTTTVPPTTTEVPPTTTEVPPTTTEIPPTTTEIPPTTTEVPPTTTEVPPTTTEVPPTTTTEVPPTTTEVPSTTTTTTTPSTTTTTPSTTTTTKPGGSHHGGGHGGNNGGHHGNGNGEDHQGVDHSGAADHSGAGSSDNSPGTHAATGTQVKKVPVGPVDAGDGSTDPGTGFGYDLLAAALALTGAVAGLIRRLGRNG